MRWAKNSLKFTKKSVIHQIFLYFDIFLTHLILGHGNSDLFFSDIIVGVQGRVRAVFRKESSPHVFNCCTDCIGIVLVFFLESKRDLLRRVKLPSRTVVYTDPAALTVCHSSPRQISFVLTTEWSEFLFFSQPSLRSRL